jgi:CHAT domain-containing protein
VLLLGGSGARVWTTRTQTGDLAPLLGALQVARTSGDVAAVLDAAGSRLGGDLIGRASSILQSAGITRLSIVASGALAGLPLAALPGPNRALAEISTVDYLIGASLQERSDGQSATETAEKDTKARTSITETRESAANPRSDAQPVKAIAAAAIINPTKDLPFTASELVALRRYAPAAVTPPAGIGLRGWLLAQLTDVQHLHLACHARYEPKNPFASRLILGDNLAVTVADLAAVATPGLAMVVASCCQTGVVDQRGADELLGLAQSLIAAGAANAVAALWEIDDMATSLLIAKFYDALVAGYPPADALADAQRQLRALTMRELAELARPNNDSSWVPDQLRRELRALALHPDLRSPDTQPFVHPAHWAGLVYLAG